MRKLALALGLLLLVAPGAFAQYGGGSGTQTYTFPSLTIDPGPMTVNGTTTFTGPFLLSNGTEAAPGLSWADETDSGWYRSAAGDFRFSINGGTNGDIFRLREQDADTTWAYFTCAHCTAPNPLTLKMDSGTQTHILSMSNESVATVPWQISAAETLATMNLGTGGAGYDYNINLWGAPADSFIRHYDDNEFTNYIQLKFADATGTRTATFPDSTGQVMLSGTNTLSTTFIVEATVGVDTTYFALTSNTITIDADRDDDGDGTVIIDAANSTTQVRLDQGGVTIKNYLELASTTFAALGAPTDGSLIYCSDCTKGSTPCTGSSTGSVAKREAGAWNCD